MLEDEEESRDSDSESDHSGRISPYSLQRNIRRGGKKQGNLGKYIII